MPTKSEPSYFEHVDDIHSMHDNSFSWKVVKGMGKLSVVVKNNAVPLLDQFHPDCHPYIVDVKFDSHSGYQSILLLGMDEDSSPTTLKITNKPQIMQEPRRSPTKKINKYITQIVNM